MKEITEVKIYDKKSGKVDTSDMNMRYVSEESYDFDGKSAVLHCAYWKMSNLENWLPGFSFEALHVIQEWLGNADHISVGSSLKIWID